MKTEIERYKQKIKNKDYFKETLMEKWTMKAKPYLSSSVKFQGRDFWTGLAEVQWYTVSARKCAF